VSSGTQTGEQTAPSLLGGVARRTITAVVVILALFAVLRIAAGRERLIAQAHAAARSAVASPAAANPPRTHLFLFSTSGDLVGSASADEAATRGLEGRAESLALGAGKDAPVATLWRAPDGSLHALAAAATPGAGVRVAATKVAPVAPTALRVLLESAAAAALIIASILWIVGTASSSLRKSLRKLTAAVSRISKTERPRDLPPPDFDEFRRLTGTLDTALGSLAERLTLLGAQRAEAKAILRSMPGAVFALDLEQRIMNTNRVAERVLDLDPDAVRGRLLHEVVRQPDLLAFAAASAGVPDLRTAEFTLRGVTERVVAASSRPLLDADGELTGVVIVLQDVTRLRKLENLRRDFAANASHELRTPVTNILGYVETLDEYSDMSAEERSRFITIIRRNAERLAAIIEDMLELARLESPESGGLREIARTDLAELLEDVRNAFAPDVERKNIELILDVEPGVAAELNRGLIAQAIGNLLANAIRYSPENTAIHLRAARVASEPGRPLVELVVEDEGPGIPEEHLSRLFERFYRVDPARSRELGGTGLGLAIAKHVAMLHGGEIGVTSELNAGSRFWLRIPARAPREATSAAKPGA